MRLKKSIKRGIAAVTITGIMASSAMPAFAKDYHIDYGDIKVDQDKVSYTDKDGTKYDNEKNEDGDITITGKSDENTVSVKDADVTFKDLEIDRSASSTAADGAAVSVVSFNPDEHREFVFSRGEGDVFYLDGNRITCEEMLFFLAYENARMYRM